MDTQESTKTDAFSSDDERIVSLLDGLKRVEAPTDFNFRVKARIAQGRPRERKAFGVPVLVRYIVPAALLMVVAYFGFNALRAAKPTTPEVAGPAPAAVAPQMPVEIAKNPAVPVANDSTKAVDDVQKSTNSNTTSARNDKKSLKNNLAQSENFELSSGPGKTLSQKGVETNTNSSQRPSGFDGGSQVSVKDVLSLMGVKATFNGSGWKVESVNASSMSARSGIMSGDVIEAINDQPVLEKTTFGSTFNGRTVRVRRDGKSLTIVLK